MIIRCPHCEHSRTMPDDKVPASAEFATCPKCRQRFRFRTLEPMRDARPLFEESAPPLTAPASSTLSPKKTPDIWDAMDAMHQALEQPSYTQPPPTDLQSKRPSPEPPPAASPNTGTFISPQLALDKVPPASSINLSAQDQEFLASRQQAKQPQGVGGKSLLTALGKIFSKNKDDITSKDNQGNGLPDEFEERPSFQPETLFLDQTLPDYDQQETPEYYDDEQRIAPYSSQESFERPSNRHAEVPQYAILQEPPQQSWPDEEHQDSIIAPSDNQLIQVPRPASPEVSHPLAEQAAQAPTESPHPFSPTLVGWTRDEQAVALHQTNIAATDHSDVYQDVAERTDTAEETRVDTLPLPTFGSDEDPLSPVLEQQAAASHLQQPTPEPDYSPHASAQSTLTVQGLPPFIDQPLSQENEPSLTVETSLAQEQETHSAAEAASYNPETFSAYIKEQPPASHDEPPVELETVIEQPDSQPAAVATLPEQITSQNDEFQHLGTSAFSPENFADTLQQTKNTVTPNQLKSGTEGIALENDNEQDHPDVAKSIRTVALLDIPLAPPTATALYADRTTSPEEKADQHIQVLLHEQERPMKDLGKLEEKLPSLGGNRDSFDIMNAIPWENMQKFGWITAYVRTIHAVMFNGPFFYQHMSIKPHLGPSYLFFLIQGYLAILCTYAWGFAVERLLLIPGEATTEPHYALPALLLLAPILLGLGQILLSGSIKVCLQIFAPEKAQFATLFKIVGYASAPLVLCIVPFIGPLVGILWFLASLGTGCHIGLRMTWRQTLFGPLLSAVLLIVALVYCFL